MIRLGIIGSGFGLYGLVPAFYPIKGCQIAAVCANNPQRLKRYCTPRKITNIFTDWRLMLKGEPLDAVALAVTPRAQYEIAKVILEQGLPVFFEKPLADTYDHAKDLARLARAHHVTTAVDFEFPELPPWKHVKSLLEAKTYGRLRHLSISWDFTADYIAQNKKSWKSDPAQGGGALSYYFCHVLYYLEWFAGRISHLQSLLTYPKTQKHRGETGVDSLVQFQNGVTGSAHLSCDAPGLTRHQLLLYFEKATIELTCNRGFMDNFRVYLHQKNSTRTVHITTNKSPEDKRVQAVRAIASRFIEAVKNNRLTNPSVEDGLRVQELIRMIRQ